MERALAIGEYSQISAACSFLESSIALLCMSVLACSLKLDARRFVEPSMNAGLKFQELRI